VGLSDTGRVRLAPGGPLARAPDVGTPLWMPLGRKKPAKGANKKGTHKGCPYVAGR